MTPPTDKGPLLVTHHGAGSSALSFALFAFEVRKALPNAGVLSLDARGHGETVIGPLGSQNNDASLDLSLETLSQDLIDVIYMTQAQMAWQELPGLVLVGHSLGGAVVTNVAVKGKLGSAVLGYAVLDVVEGMRYKHVDTPLYSLLMFSWCRLCDRCTPKHAVLSVHQTQDFSFHHFGYRMAVSNSKYSYSSLVSSQTLTPNKYTLSHNPQ